MVPASHILRHGICPTSRKQHPTWNSVQRLPSPAWHLALSIDCVRYQHSVNQSQFSGSKVVSQGSACSHGKMAAQRREVLGSARATGWLWDGCQGTGEIQPWQTAGSNFTAAFSLSLSTECCCWQQRPERDGWERIIREEGKAL